jgi:SSS family solute:Na+ symporter
MKAFSAKDGRTIRRTVVLYPTFQIFLIPILLIGFAGVGFEPPPAQADQILPHLLMHMDMPAVLVGLFCAGALAASMSSGDAIAHAAASIVVRDGWITTFRRSMQPEKERAASRVVLVVLMVAAYLLAISWQGTLVQLLLHWAYGPVTQLAPPLWAALLWKRASAAGAIAGLAGGIVVNTLLLVWPALLPWDVHAGLVALAVNVVLLVGVSLLRPRRT